MSVHKYEMLMILDPQLDENSVKKLIKKYLEVVTDGNGTVENTDIWGRRKFAYEIDKKTEGIYVLLNYTCEPGVDAELERQLKLNESVMRTKVIRK